LRKRGVLEGPTACGIPADRECRGTSILAKIMG